MHSQLGNCWKCGPVGKANLSEDEEQIHTRGIAVAIA